MNRIIAAGLLLLFFGNYAAMAQQDFQLDTVAIETSRLGLSSDQTGRFVTVLTQQDIQALPARSVDELLRFLPGLEVQARGAFGTQADFTMRGGTFNQVLVLMDGMRINDPLTGHFQAYLPVTMAEIHRIEILRGPASAMYGPDAVGGIIHIITNTFAQTQAQAEQATLQGQAQVGNHAFWGGELTGTLRQQRLRGSVSGRWQQSDGQPKRLNDGRSDFAMGTATASLGLGLPRGWDLALRAGYDQRTFDAQYYYTTSSFDQSREQTGRLWTQARLQQVQPGQMTRMDISYLQSRDSFLFNPAFSANVHQTQFVNLNMLHRRELSRQFSWAVGAQGSFRSIKSNDRGDHADPHGAVFGMAYWQPTDGLHLSGSLRGDYDANYGVEVTPQVNLSYLTGAWVLRASTGRSIRAADYTERFISTNLAGPLPAGRNLGNPDLEAERSWNFEVGADLRLPANWLVSTTVFLRDGRNLIDYLRTPYEAIPNNANLTPGATYFFANNLSAMRTWGTEGFVQYQGKLGTAQHLTADLGITWLETDADQNLASKYLANNARWQLSSRWLWTWQQLTVGVQGLYRLRDPESASAIGAALTEQFTVWHAQARYALLEGALGLQLQVFNLANVSYSDFLGAEMPGRWWLIGLQWQLGQR